MSIVFYTTWAHLHSHVRSNCLKVYIFPSSLLRHCTLTQDGQNKEVCRVWPRDLLSPFPQGPGWLRPSCWAVHPWLPALKFVPVSSAWWYHITWQSLLVCNRGSSKKFHGIQLCCEVADVTWYPMLMENALCRRYLQLCGGRLSPLLSRLCSPHGMCCSNSPLAHLDPPNCNVMDQINKVQRSWAILRDREGSCSRLLSIVGVIIRGSSKDRNNHHKHMWLGRCSRTSEAIPCKPKQGWASG